MAFMTALGLVVVDLSLDHWVKKDCDSSSNLGMGLASISQGTGSMRESQHSPKSHKRYLEVILLFFH